MGIGSDQNAHASSAASSRAPSSRRATASASASASTSISAITTRDRKRKHQNDNGHETYHGHATSLEQDEPKGKQAKKIKPAAPAGEKRLRRSVSSPALLPFLPFHRDKKYMSNTNCSHLRFRSQPPSSFHAINERATTQRFFVLSRTLCGTHHCPEMFLEVSGSTGNVYNVCIARQPTCDCPHARKGNQCKHTIFVMTKVLRAKREYVYQLALLSEELRDIFANCPNPADDKAAGGQNDKNRKPIDGDCPICFEEMESGPSKEALVWCKAACGQNIHRQCFDMWATTKRQSHGPGGITCPYCRSTWESDGEEPKVDLASIKRGAVNSEGYVNVADQLGISTQRDYSTYSNWWSGNPSFRGGW